MSLILDALNRSRQDTDKVPGLATQHYVDDGASDDKGRQYLPWLALLVALAIIGWLLLDRETGQVPASLPQAAMPVSPAPPESARAGDEGTAPAAEAQQAPPAQITAAPAVTAGSPRDIERTPVTASQPVAKDPMVAELYQHPQTAANNVSRPAPEPQSPSVKQVKEPSAVGLKEPSATAAGTSQEEQPIDIEKMILQARDELENVALEEHSVPLLSSLSQQTKDSIPTIFYERHDYSDNQSQSSVVLNGKSVRAGGSPAAGLKVEEILPDSVVLNYRGTQFRLRALNSWVNL